MVSKKTTKPTADKKVEEQVEVLKEAAQKAVKDVAEVKNDIREAASEIKDISKEVSETVKEDAIEKITAVKNTVEKTSKTVKTTAKKSAAKAKATVEKKAAAAKKKITKPEKKIVLQYLGKEFDEAELTDRAIAQFHSVEGAVEVKDITMYLKPEEDAAYYVINESYTGRVDF